MFWLRHVTHAILHLYMAHQFSVLFFVLLVEEAGLPSPLPGDSLVALAGTHNKISLGYTLSVIAISTLAVFIGSSLLYYLMRRGGRPFLDRYGKWLHLTPQRLDRMELWFQRHGAVAIIIGRLIPGLRGPTTVMAGISGVPYRTFLPATLGAAALWSIFYFYAGLLLQRSLVRVPAFIAGELDSVGDWVVLVLSLLVLASAIIVLRFRHVRRRTRRETTARQSKLLSV